MKAGVIIMNFFTTMSSSSTIEGKLRKVPYLTHTILYVDAVNNLPAVILG